MPFKKEEEERAGGGVSVEMLKDIRWVKVIWWWPSKGPSEGWPCGKKRKIRRRGKGALPRWKEEPATFSVCSIFYFNPCTSAPLFRMDRTFDYVLQWKGKGSSKLKVTF